MRPNDSIDPLITNGQGEAKIHNLLLAIKFFEPQTMKGNKVNNNFVL